MSDRNANVTLSPVPPFGFAHNGERRAILGIRELVQFCHSKTKDETARSNVTSPGRPHFSCVFVRGSFWSETAENDDHIISIGTSGDCSGGGGPQARFVPSRIQSPCHVVQFSITKPCADRPVLASALLVLSSRA